MIATLNPLRPGGLPHRAKASAPPRGPAARTQCRCSATPGSVVAYNKQKILQLAALTDRGQRTNKLVAEIFQEEKDLVKELVNELVHAQANERITQETLKGEWELVYSDVELFRSSPFFLAIESAFNDKKKSDLFFKLHLLQVGSWGVSTIGRVAQSLDFDEQVLDSSFDTILFGLTVIPILGWFKLLPTFGGRVISRAVNLSYNEDSRQLSMELERTQAISSKGVPLLPAIGNFLVERWLPVGAVWRLLPWNQGRAPICSVTVLYADEHMRIVEDMHKALFIYTRPLIA